MGWLWSSSAPTKPPNGSDESPSDPREDRSASQSYPPDGPQRDASITKFDSNTTTHSPTSNADFHTDEDQSRPRSRDEIANDELLSYFRQLQIERRSEAAELERETRVAAADEDYDEEEDDEPPELLTPARLYDRKMRCRELLDTAWFCASPGGQFFNLYRYGTLRQCGQLWVDMTYCWRINRSIFDAEKREQRSLQRAWSRERDRLRERGGCSEEVWGEGRRWVERNAFKADWEGEDSPWRTGVDDEGRA